MVFNLIDFLFGIVLASVSLSIFMSWLCFCGLLDGALRFRPHAVLLYWGTGIRLMHALWLVAAAQGCVWIVFWEWFPRKVLQGFAKFPSFIQFDLGVTPVLLDWEFVPWIWAMELVELSMQVHYCKERGSHSEILMRFNHYGITFETMYWGGGKQ